MNATTSADEATVTITVPRRIKWLLNGEYCRYSESFRVALVTLLITLTIVAAVVTLIAVIWTVGDSFTYEHLQCEFRKCEQIGDHWKVSVHQTDYDVLRIMEVSNDVGPELCSSWAKKYTPDTRSNNAKYDCFVFAGYDQKYASIKFDMNFPRGFAMIAYPSIAWTIAIVSIYAVMCCKQIWAHILETESKIRAGNKINP